MSHQVEHVNVDVLDLEGGGIATEPAWTDQIFEGFNRFHHDSPGTGIDLARGQEIVDDRAGDFRVEFEPGEGSTPVVTLPKRPTD